MTKKIQNKLKYYGLDKIRKISRKLNLPEWWIQSVIIEYFPCRKFLQNGQLYQFDFNMFDDTSIDDLKNYKVLIPSGSWLIQNINPIDFSNRVPRAIVGQYVEPLNESDVHPEGPVNPNAFLFSGNNFMINDPKQNFNWYGIVYDNKLFYQYKIAESYEFNKSCSWFKSSLFDLLPLKDIQDQLDNISSTVRVNELDQKQKKDLQLKVKNLYKKLEKIRQPIREKILEYHNMKKQSYDGKKIIELQPPLLMFNDRLRSVDNGFEIESHMEPIFYEAAYDNYQLAKKSRENQYDKNFDHIAFVYEIKYSAICIICSISCLESYINFIIKEYLPEESKIFDKTSTHKQKWLYVPLALNLCFSYSITEPPYKIFLDLIKWRNGVIHHIPEFSKVKIFKSKKHQGYVSALYRTFNLENSELAIKCINEMILSLSKGNKIPVPRWINHDKIPP